MESVRPGDTVLAGIHLRMDEHWHVYWKNAGASGIPTKVDWILPRGISAGDIQWPTPEKIPPVDVATYGYNHEVVLLVPLKFEGTLSSGPKEIKANVEWLECKDVSFPDSACLPGRAQVSATLNIGSETRPSADAALIEAWKKKLPVAGDQLGARGSWEKPATGDSRPIVLEWTLPPGATGPDFYPARDEAYEVEGPSEQLPAEAGKVRLRKQVLKYSGGWPKQIAGLAVHQVGNERVGYEVTISIPDAGSASVPAPETSGGTKASASAAAPAQTRSLWLMLLYAFLGGLILNVMPCVLPVIALKILGFVKDAANDPREVRKLGFIYTLGVIASFLVLAGIVIALQAANKKVAWGMQFSNPYFIIAMAVLMTLVALSLFGVFEVTPGGRTMSVATTLSSKQGAAGAFFNGLLATVLATSCVAPLLGGAVGFAVGQKQPPQVIVAFALTIGLGLAAPYLLLSWQPAWLKFLPKPGPWMENFKIAMGFPMLATAVWLCSLLTTFYGERTWAFVMFLVILAVAAWVFGQFFQRGSRHRAAAIGTVFILLIAGYAYALEKRLHWRYPSDGSETVATTTAVPSNLSPKGYAWQPWSLKAIAAARAEGRPVLVDFTAKWCPTCNLNVKPVLGSDAVVNKLKELNAVALLADYTRFPDDMTEELSRHGRAGVPLVLVYPSDPAAAPIVLPEAVTQGIVLDALNQASQRLAKNN